MINNSINLKAKELVNEVWKEPSKFESNYQKIIDLMANVLEQDKNNISALTNLGAAYCDTNQYDEALFVLKKAESLGSKDKNTYFNIGVALINSNSTSAHKKYFILSNSLKASDFTIEAYCDFMGY